MRTTGGCACGLFAGVEAADAAYGEFAFELYGDAGFVGCDPCVHVVGGALLAVGGEYEAYVVGVVGAVVVFYFVDAEVFDGEEFFALSGEDVDGDYLSFLHGGEVECAHEVEGAEHIDGGAHGFEL